MPIIPLFGHERLRRRLSDAATRGTLPSSLLLQGPRGVGKQRLALWLAQVLLCTGTEPPCGGCQGCRYVEALAHPDLHWYFPRPRLKDADASPEEVRDDFREAIQERLKSQGLYSPPSGTEGIFVATVRSLLQAASMRPALGRRKVFIVGDAERMVPQAGSEEAANAFLKLLEEPPADTTIILTSSEPGALLPTIRSRVVTLRAVPLPDDDVLAFLRHPAVGKELGSGGPPEADRVRIAAGAPGNLLAEGGWQASLENARKLLDAATGPRAARLRTAFGQGVSKARGSFTDTLDALTVLLHDRARNAARQQDERRAAGAALAVDAVERAKEMAAGNVNPQLVSVALLGELARHLGSADGG